MTVLSFSGCWFCKACTCTVPSCTGEAGVEGVDPNSWHSCHPSAPLGELPLIETSSLYLQMTVIIRTCVSQGRLRDDGGLPEVHAT